MLVRGKRAEERGEGERGETTARLYVLRAPRVRTLNATCCEFCYKSRALSGVETLRAIEHALSAETWPAHACFADRSFPERVWGIDGRTDGR